MYPKPLKRRTPTFPIYLRAILKVATVNKKILMFELVFLLLLHSSRCAVSSRAAPSKEKVGLLT